MTELKYILVEELLNALDDIQRDVPFILDYYVDTGFNAEDNIHMDIDLLTMNIMSLRDSAKLIRDTISINSELPWSSYFNYTPQCTDIASATAKDSLSHTSLQCKESYDNLSLCGNPASISPQVKQLAFAMFLHTHMLTDPESIYNSDIIGNKNLFNTVEL